MKRLPYYVSSVLFILLLSVTSSCDDKTPPSEEVILSLKQAVTRLDSLSRLQEITRDEANSRIEAEIAGLGLDYMTLEQIEDISQGGMLYRYNALRKACQPSFIVLAKNPGLNGAVASAMYTVNFPMAETGDDEFQNQLMWVEAYKDFVNHPSIGELMSGDHPMSSTVFGRIQFLDPNAIANSGLVEEIIPLLDLPMSADCGGTSVIFFDVVSKPECESSPEIVEEVRLKVLKKTRQALEELQSAESPRQSSIEHLEHVIGYLKGASSRGKLIGYKAPEIHFDYGTMAGLELLSELEGKVVILDFWATWCSPCVGSFPNIRALQERYKDYQVVILGITSLQGSHTDQVNKRRIDTKGNPELEYYLMDGCIKDMDITWEVALSRESQFNEEFGVRGIPHVAIIDADGIVRYNRLRPYEAPWKEAEKIDSLLSEAGLGYPSEPMERTNYSEEGH